MVFTSGMSLVMMTMYVVVLMLVVVTEARIPRGYVKKSAFNDVRVVFIAGLEGTGHHDWPRFGSLCTKCDSVHEASLTLWYNISVADTGEKRNEGIATFTEQLRLARDQGDAQVLFLNGIRSKHSYNYNAQHPLKSILMMSFPSKVGRNKALQFVDIALVANICEQLGMDFRVIYVHREAEDIIKSTTINRQFSSNMGPVQEIRVLAANARYV
jgi:hypothetical protein